jgi:hypothetical protein
MPIEFQYLTTDSARGAERGPDNTVGARFRRADLARRPVIRDELNNKYLVFESRAEFGRWYRELPAPERACHEVVFGWAPQRLKFDVDAAAHKLDALSDTVLAAALPPPDELGEELAEFLGFDAPPLTAEETRAARIRAIVGVLIEAILDELYIAYYAVEDIAATRDALAVTDSSGPTRDGWKYSYHVLVMPFYVADNEEAREFTDRVLERLPPPLRAFVDAGVNKSTQNFRLAGSAKPGTGRFKVPTAAFGTRLVDDDATALLVTAPPGARVLARVYTDAGDSAKRAARPPSLSLNSPAVAVALELAAAAGVTAGHSVTEVRGTLICFARDAPTHCRICGEPHRRDNSLMLSLEPAEGGHAGPWPGAGPLRVRVVEHCRQARGRGVAVGEIVVDAGVLAAPTRAAKARGDAPPTPGERERIAARIEAIRAGRVNPHDALASEFERLPEELKTIYAEPQMRAYELVPTLAVAAQMKLGKTKALRAYIDAHFPADGLETRVVRFVTFRQTFGRALTGAFPDFVLYSDVQGDLTAARHPRAIVQVESLHRLRMAAAPEPIDLLVLDEVESILAQFNSGLHRHFTAAFAMFQWMMRTARHVVCMDANLSDRTFRTLARLRPGHGPPRFHWNRFARAADDAYFITADQAAWLEALHAAVRAGQRVVLPSNSLGEAKAFEAALRREFPAKKVALYSSETAPTEKARHFGDVHTYWGDLDVLIYTPTCSAGVSFELPWYDVLFGYFCDASCDVETCRQMLGRVRNLRTREHHLCIRAGPCAALPTTVDAIRRGVYDKRAGLYRDLSDAALQFEYSPDDGSLQYHESDYFHMWLETVRMDNLSRNDFAARFIDQVADTGASVDVLRPPPGRDGAALLASHRDEKSAAKWTHSEAVAAAADIAADEALRIREAMQAQADVEPARALAYQKWQLREAYGWRDRPVDADFVATYGAPAAKRVYRNLLRITDAPTVFEALQRMQEREASHYAFAMETRVPAMGYVNESRDLLRERSTYVFQSHYLAIWLLRVCGFRCITDKAHVSDAAVEARLRAALPLLKKNVDRIVAEFEVPAPNVDAMAREPDRARFLGRALRTVNAVLRMMYGVGLKKLAKRAGGGAYYLSHSDIGMAFVFSEGPADVPHIPSKLLPLPPVDKVDLFLEAQYYGAGVQLRDDLMPAAEPADDTATAEMPAITPAPMPVTPAATPMPAFTLDDLFAEAPMPAGIASPAPDDNLLAELLGESENEEDYLASILGE